MLFQSTPSIKGEEKMKKIGAFWIIFLLSIVSAEAKQPRKFYLTQTDFTGSQPLTSCANDYHMASLWEIFDPSNLRYDSTLGYALDDSGFGPPTSVFGWIRTGNQRNGFTLRAGLSNCDLWTRDIEFAFGTVVALNDFWTDVPNRIDPWLPAVSICSFPRKVWC